MMLGPLWGFTQQPVSEPPMKPSSWASAGVFGQVPASQEYTSRGRIGWTNMGDKRGSGSCFLFAVCRGSSFSKKVSAGDHYSKPSGGCWKIFIPRYGYVKNYPLLFRQNGFDPR